MNEVWLWGSGFVLFKDGKLRGESGCCDHGWWTHQRYEDVSCFLLEQTGFSVIGILNAGQKLEF